MDPKAAMAKAQALWQDHLAAVGEKYDAMRDRDRTKWETSWRELDAREAETAAAHKAACDELSTIFEQVFGVHPMDGLAHIRY